MQNISIMDQTHYIILYIKGNYSQLQKQFLWTINFNNATYVPYIAAISRLNMTIIGIVNRT